MFYSSQGQLPSVTLWHYYNIFDYIPQAVPFFPVLYSFHNCHSNFFYPFHLSAPAATFSFSFHLRVYWAPAVRYCAKCMALRIQKWIRQTSLLSRPSWSREGGHRALRWHQYVVFPAIIKKYIGWYVSPEEGLRKAFPKAGYLSWTLKGAVLVFYEGCNKSQHMYWLNTTTTYYHPAL